MDMSIPPRVSTKLSSTPSQYGSVEQTNNIPSSSDMGAAGHSQTAISTPPTPSAPPAPLEKPDHGQRIEIDQNIKAALPAGCHFVEATAYGSSLWTRTAKITAVSDTGEECAFFLKTASGELGEAMFKGEFEGMSAIHQTMPDFSPRPIAWGRCTDTTDLFFFLSAFVRMDQGDVPDAGKLCAKLAKMHRESVSPTGQFGFHVTTCNGNIPQNNTWNESWEVFFSDGLRYMLALDVKVNGEQPELVEAMQPIFDCVIPRLLGPLEQGPNRIRPALVHGDLWFGNCSTNLDTDEPVIFDAAAFYAHNEYELGNWRPARNLLNTVHLDVYKTLNPPCHPAAEFEDRIMLYEIRFNLHFCILLSGLKDTKKVMISNIKYLAEKYPSEELKG
ncbi:hypothetical protein MY4824_008913 [Beauveria thailandica]